MDPFSPTTIPDPSPSSSAWTTPSLPRFFLSFSTRHFLSRPPSSSSHHCHCCGRLYPSSPNTFPTHCRPPLPRPRLHFPGFSLVFSTGLFLSQPPSSSGCHRHRYGRLDPSSSTTVPDPSPSSSARTEPSFLDFSLVFSTRLFLSRLPSSYGRRHHHCGQHDPSSPTTVPNPLPSSSTRTAPSLPRFFFEFSHRAFSSLGHPLPLAAAATTVVD